LPNVQAKTDLIDRKNEVSRIRSPAGSLVLTPISPLSQGV